MQQSFVKGVSLLLMRVMLSGIFFVAGINHLLFQDKIIGRLEQASFPELALIFGSPETLVYLSGLFMLIGGTNLLIGFLTRWAATRLILIVMPITITNQIGQWATAGPLMKNIAILGVLVLFALNGSVRYGLDQQLFQSSKMTCHEFK